MATLINHHLVNGNSKYFQTYIIFKFIISFLSNVEHIFVIYQI